MNGNGMKNPYECEIIKKLMEMEVPLTIKPNGIQVGGFYKSGNILLRHPTEDEIGAHGCDVAYIAECRYDEKSEICSFRDLLYLQLEWYDRWISRNGQCAPHPAWEEALLEEDLIERRMEPRYSIKNRRV